MTGWRPASRLGIVGGADVRATTPGSQAERPTWKPGYPGQGTGLPQGQERES